MSIVDSIVQALTGTPSNQKINRDIRELEAELGPYRKRLIRIPDSELRDLSDHRLDYRKTRNWKKNNLTLISTIFDEPAVCYGVKKYKKKRREGIVLGYFNDSSYVIRFREKNTQLFVNDKFFGLLNNKGKISRGRTQKVLASIDTSGTIRTVRVQEKSIASFNFEPTSSSKVRKRQLHYGNPRNDADRHVILLYYLLTLIKKYEL